jgi:hypothetical protein
MEEEEEARACIACELSPEHMYAEPACPAHDVIVVGDSVWREGHRAAAQRAAVEVEGCAGEEHARTPREAVNTCPCAVDHVCEREARTCARAETCDEC